jgi:hypothetical protein
MHSRAAGIDRPSGLIAPLHPGASIVILGSRMLGGFRRPWGVDPVSAHYETRDISNITYFGAPVYTYTLKKGTCAR